MAKTESSRGPSARLSIPLNADGTGFDWNQMRDGTKRRLAEIVSFDVDRIMTEAGLEVASGDGGEDENSLNLLGGITEENVKTGIDLVAQAGALAIKMVGPRFLKHPFLRDGKTGKPIPLRIDDDILQFAFKIKEDQHAELDPRALRLAKKYLKNTPEWIQKNLDLYMFALMFFKYQAENATTAIKSQIARDVLKVQKIQEKETKTAPDPSPFPGPGPENGDAIAAGVA